MNIIALPRWRRTEFDAFHARQAEHAMECAGEVIELHSSAKVGLRRAWITRDDLRAAKRNGEPHVRLIILRQGERRPGSAVQQSLAVDYVKERIIFPVRRLDGLRFHTASN